jgi:hypothetical protein
MRWGRPLAIIVVIVLLWGVLEIVQGQLGDTLPGPSGDRGIHGVEFVVPEGVTVVDLGEANHRLFADRALAAHRNSPETTLAFSFTRSGSAFQILVEPGEDRIDERVYGREGTASRVLWPGGIEERLVWCGEHGNFSLPGALPPDKRNPYH